MQAVGQACQRIVHGLVGQALLGTQALTDLPKQLFVDLGQFAGAFLNALFQLGMCRTQPLLVALARKPGSDVLRNEGQQPLIVHAERAVLAVALHHDRTHHLIVAQQRHAQPAMRARAGLAHFTTGQQRIDLRA